MFKWPWKQEPPNAAAETVSATEPVFGLRTVRPPPSPDNPQDPPLNIIFVHGLGGSADGTWTDTKTGAVWLPWLSEMPGLGNARIMTFGYNSAWNSIWKPNNILDIADFGQQLANELWLHYLEHGDAPTFFVAHSMGGLVVKKAIILAHNIDQYSGILRNTIGIAFLGTPHRGADLAKILGGLLNVTFSESRFVKDLSPTSQLIKDINNTFGGRAEGLKLASFWESTGVPVVGTIVPEYSATLGFPGEIRVALNADHISMVKFSSKDDNNYRVVSRTLAALIADARRSRST